MFLKWVSGRRGERGGVGQTVLIADDDEMTQTLLTNYLEEMDFQVSCVGSGQEALDLICRRSFGLYLLDLYMDDMSGLDVLQEIRLTPRLIDRPVLMISAEQHPASMEVALQFGANDYLTKPIDPDWLRTKIRRCFPAVPTPPLPAGSRLGRYELVEPLMDGFYRASDTRLRRPVWLKTGSDQNEAIALAAVRHPRVQTIYDQEADYLVLEPVEGTPLGPDSSLAVARTLELLEGLGAAHAAGVVHANLSPQSTLVTPGGVKLAYFGVTRPQAFAAPEQVDPLFGEVGPRTDLFSAASLLQFLLTGSPPFNPDLPFQQLLTIAFGQPAPIEAASPQLVAICARGLKKDQNQRYQSAEEFVEALRGLR